MFAMLVVADWSEDEGEGGFMLRNTFSSADVNVFILFFEVEHICGGIPHGWLGQGLVHPHMELL